MIDFEKYICVDDLIVGDSAPALSEITSLGLLGRLDFYIVLQDVCVIWMAVFGGHKDCCGFHRTSGSEFFKITAESLGKLVIASKGGQVLRVVQLELEVPVEVKVGYGLEPDYYTLNYAVFPDPAPRTPRRPLTFRSTNPPVIETFSTNWLQCGQQAMSSKSGIMLVGKTLSWTTRVGITSSWATWVGNQNGG